MGRLQSLLQPATEFNEFAMHYIFITTSLLTSSSLFENKLNLKASNNKKPPKLRDVFEGLDNSFL